MKEYQRIELELLKVFLDVCEKLNLKYFLVCGSALGAVKYKGFIPWDDDIDIGMLRPDYEEFIRKAPELLPQHIFLQNYISDPFYPSINSKLRDSNTTWIEKGVKHLDIHHGIGIDIFPIDGYPKTKKDISKFERKHMHYERIRALSYYVDRTKPTLKSLLAVRTQMVYVLNKLFGLYSDSTDNIKQYSIFLAKNHVNESYLWCNFGNWQGKLEYAPIHQYGEGVWATFEGIKVRIPEKYDEYLTQKYGDWRAELPDDKKKSGHYIEVCDYTRPYTDYIEKLENGRIKIKNNIN